MLPNPHRIVISVMVKFFLLSIVFARLSRISIRYSMGVSPVSFLNFRLKQEFETYPKAASFETVIFSE